MIRFECDWCQNVKTADEVWLLGLAAEVVGATTARREVTILSGWNPETALASLAVHFCSEECKADYMATLFDQAPDLTKESNRRVTASSKAGNRKSVNSKSKARTSARKRSAA